MMIKRNYRVILLAVLVLGWMGVIFAFSSQDGTASSKTSGRVVQTVIEVIKPDFDHLEKNEQISFRNAVTFFVRKGAHFTEYAILGVLLFFFFYEWRPRFLWRVWLFAWITATLYASSDEFHQMFSSGRSPQVRDVCIDSSGAAVGCFIALAIMVLVRKTKRHRKRSKEYRI